MTICQSLIPEYDQEMATTRRMLERIPDDKFTWKPHEKSMELGRLSGHIAEIPAWIPMINNQDALDIAPVGGPAYTPPPTKTRADVVALFDKSAAEGRASLAEARDEIMHKNWALLAGGNQILSMERTVCIRTWVFSHIVHHRAQLGVYLRLNDIPVPSTYGPSADEGGM